MSKHFYCMFIYFHLASWHSSATLTYAATRPNWFHNVVFSLIILIIITLAKHEL